MPRSFADEGKGLWGILQITLLSFFKDCRLILLEPARGEVALTPIKIKKYEYSLILTGGYMFINFTNHPVGKWDEAQLTAAKKHGAIIDMPFPLINPMLTKCDILALAKDYVGRITAMSPKAVLCQGEFTLVFAVVAELKKHGILTFAACSERCVSEHSEDGVMKKTATFNFVQFREY